MCIGWWLDVVVRVICEPPHAPHAMLIVWGVLWVFGDCRPARANEEAASY